MTDCASTWPILRLIRSGCTCEGRSRRTGVEDGLALVRYSRSATTEERSPATDSMITWTSAAPAVTAAFLASLVEAVEAVTIVLAVATVRGGRSAGAGALAGVGSLALIVLTLGRLLERVPLQALQLVIGVLLLLFGLQWLRKAILRAAGIIPLHDEQIVFERTSTELRNQADRHDARMDWIAALTCFKAVLLEGLEVVFIVLAVGAGHGLLRAASIGALAACALVVAIAFAVHRPLTRVPENTLKLAVGVLLSAFGVFWSGEGLGVSWPGGDLAIPGIAALFLLAAGGAIGALRRRHRVRAAARTARPPYS